MAFNLASIHGTEKDRVNCPFFFKVGACRHGDRCSRLHTRSTESQTLLLADMYESSNAAFHIQQPDSHFEEFCEDVFEELSKHGEIEELHVCDNLADHMIGNVYVKFREDEHAAAARNTLSGRFYAQRPIILDFSPVTDFREASCRQYEEHSCQKGGYCNFLHLKRISRELRRKLYYRRRCRSRSHSLYGRDRRYKDRDDRRIEEDCRQHRRSDRGKTEVEVLLQGGTVVLLAVKALRSDGLRLSKWNREREERQAPPASPPRRNSAAYDNE